VTHALEGSLNWILRRAPLSVHYDLHSFPRRVTLSEDYFFSRNSKAARSARQLKEAVEALHLIPILLHNVALSHTPKWISGVNLICIFEK